MLLALVTLGFVVSACGGSGSTPAPENAVKTVEAYLQARAKIDVNQMISLSCAAWEPNARLEATSIDGRSPALEGLACQSSGTEGGNAFVMCQGKITTSYNGEQRDFDLAERQFKLVTEGGEWRMCGYK